MKKMTPPFAPLPLAIFLALLATLRDDTAALAQPVDSWNDVVVDSRGPVGEFDRSIFVSSHRTSDEGRRIFRHDTSGDEAFRGDTLGLHDVIAGGTNDGAFSLMQESATPF